MIKPLYIESLQMPGVLTLRGSFRPGLTGNTCFSITIKTLADAPKAIKAKNDGKTEARTK